MGCSAFGGDDEKPLQGLRVLVVEDDALTAFRLARHLTNSGAQVIGPCATAVEAERRLDDTEIHVALVDLRLSDEFADRFIAAIRAKNLPFVLITGFWSSPSNADEGAVAVLLKPYDRRILIRLLSIYVPGPSGSSGE